MVALVAGSDAGPAQGARMSDSVGFAVVGCGNIGSRHLAVIEAQPRARVTAICDVDAEKCRKYAAMYGDVPAYGSITELLRSASADVISICTPHHLHAPMAIEAAAAGRHILVEKPMALTADDGRAMGAAAERAGVRLMVVKQNRYNVPVVLTKHALDQGHLGRVYTVRCSVLWNRHAGYYHESPWRGRRTMEGGALYTQVSHFLDLLIWWFGDVANASARLARRKHAVEIEDIGAAQVVFASGVVGSLDWTTCVYRRNYEGSITIVGDRGTIKIGGPYLNTIEYWDVEGHPLPPDVQFTDKPNAYGKYQGTSSNHDRVIQDVVADLLDGSANSVSAAEGLKVVEGIETIYRSAAWER